MALPSAVLTPLQHTTARISVALRLGLCIVGIPMALLAGSGRVRVEWLVAGVIAYAAWAGRYAWVALRRGLVTPLVAVDILVTVAFCLANGWIVPIEKVEDGSGWVATIGSLTVASLPLAWRAAAAIPAGLVVVAAFGASFPLAGRAGQGLVHTGIMGVQLLCAAAVMAVVRRASAAADVALNEANLSRLNAHIAEARRADEISQLRLLHDTALTTLTFVSTGTIARSETLADRATADLNAIERLAADDAAAPHRLVRLDELLARAARHPPEPLTVETALVPCLVPTEVADAFAGGASEAILNAARHAGVATATLRLATAPGRVRVEISDAGRGFDPGTAVAHRYGVRHSIIGRMAAVGGYAWVASAPGKGTQWTLEWSTPDGGE